MPWKLEEIHRSILQKETHLFDYSKGILKFALCYPQNYFLGMSNLGFHSTYHLLNSISFIQVSRFFFDIGVKDAYRDGFYSLEETKRLSGFDIIGFSVSYELDFINIVSILKKELIPLYSRDRNDSHPLIIAGGAAVTINPEPIADIVDIIVIGESENIIQEVMKEIYENRGSSKINILKRLCKIDSVYIPSFYNFRFEEGIIAEIINRNEAPKKIKRNAPNKLDFCTSTVILTPDTEFSGSFLFEISRGCVHKCGFCSVYTCYSPYRYRKYDILRSYFTSFEGLIDKVGIISADIFSHPEYEDIIDFFIQRNIKLSFSSLRMEKVTDKLLDTLKFSGQNTITIAPESASEERRKMIGKLLTDDEIFESLKKISKSAIKRVKMYLMCGLPGYKNEADEILLFFKKISQYNLKYFKNSIDFIFSINQFVPKPQTFFERNKMADIEYIDETYKKIKKDSRGLNIKTDFLDPKISFMSLVLSRSDRRCANFLEIISDKGFKTKIVDLLKEADLKRDFFTGEIKKSSIVPWDLIK